MRAGEGARALPGETKELEWTLPGFARREIEPCVGHEPRIAGAPRGSHKPVSLQTRGRGRQSQRTFWGAGRRQGPGTTPACLREPQRLDPDGWLVRIQSDAYSIESPAARQTSPGTVLKPRTPSPNARGPELGNARPLDMRLLMGGNARERRWPVWPQSLWRRLVACPERAAKSVQGPSPLPAPRQVRRASAKQSSGRRSHGECSPARPRGGSLGPRRSENGHSKSHEWPTGRPQDVRP